MKKMLALALAFLMAFALCAQAEGGALPLVQAANKLALETGNVTLKATASFTYDGDWFKTFNGEYRQDGENSYMYVSLDSPKNGGIYTGGYTVVGNGANVYYSETFQGNYYNIITGVPSSTVIRATPKLTAAAMVLEGAASLVNDAMKDDISYENGVINVNIASVPPIVDGVLNYVATDYLSYNNYADYSIPSVTYEDYEKLIVVYYEREFGHPMPDDFMDNVLYSDYCDDTETYYALSNAIYNDVYNESSTKKGRVLYVSADGTYAWYDSDEDYLRALGIDYLYYDDYTATVLDYYAKQYGEKLSDETVTAISYSDNPALWEAYADVCNQVDSFYYAIAAQNPDTVALLIHTDGTYEELTKLVSDGSMTVTRIIMSDFRKASVSGVKAVVEMNADGTIASAKGTASFVITDKKNAQHTLEVEFDCSAADYGTTHVGEFKAEDYGLMTYDEYFGTYYGETESYEFDYEALIASLPKTVEFAGKTYSVLGE